MSQKFSTLFGRDCSYGSEPQLFFFGDIPLSIIYMAGSAIITNKRCLLNRFVFHRPDPNACIQINKFFGSPRDPIDTKKCPGTQHNDICWFTNETKLDCSSKVCGSSTISLGRRDLKDGHITSWNPITPFSTDKVWSFVQATLKEGDTFCFMKCGSILQALVFPPELFLKKNDKKDDKKININVVVMDSISRPHFYRMMKKSVNAFRDVVYNENIPATALDFELFQSIGTSTFENIRAFFSGFFVGMVQLVNMLSTFYTVKLFFIIRYK